MTRSLIGDKMAAMSGLRSIMEDIAMSTAHSSPAEWLNLGIGNPAPIPEVIEMWRELTERAMADSFVDASCSYGPSRGAPELVDAVVEYFNGRYGWGIREENVIVGPGSQMLCFMAAALYAGPSISSCPKLVLPITPDYTGYQGLCMNTGGVAGVEASLALGERRSFRYGFDLPALERRDDIGMMLLSSPCNPTGRCISADELATLIGIADRRDAPLVIDHAYGEPFPQICQSVTPPVFHPQVINCFSLSKAGLPGERVGFAIGHERYVDEMVSFLANSALHSSRLAQMATANALRSGRLDALVSSVITGFYADRRTRAEKLLSESMPPSVDWWLHAAQGGMFCWLWINEDWFDDMELYRILKLRHVFITPGRSFFTGDHGSASSRSHSTRCFRISLTVDEDILVAGINRVADAVRELRDTAA